MLRTTCVVSGLLLFASVSRGDDCLGNVCSYSGTFADDTPIGTAPPEGFILTDILIGTQGSTDIRFLENGAVKARAYIILEASAGTGSIHFRTGIPFAGGTVITSQHNRSLVEVTLSGYIPGPSTAAIPALGNVGLGILIATIAAAGGWVISRQTGFVRAA